MKKIIALITTLCVAINFEGFSASKTANDTYKKKIKEVRLLQIMERKMRMKINQDISTLYTVNSKINDVIADPTFGKAGRLIFPINGSYYSGNTLGELQLAWYSHINPNKTVEIVNYMKENAIAGDTIFFDIYTKDEKKVDPTKKDTGLFFFKGNSGGKFAICNAGGGFVYVGAMQDSFPHALELSKLGYNAFALIYRPGAQTACEDLARAIRFVFEHAKELKIDTSCYSLWGGSAGGRMAAYLGTYGPITFGGGNLPKPGTIILQYTGHREYGKNDPPTYSCVGSEDPIANWYVMQKRLSLMDKYGIPTEFHVYKGLPHGFGLGEGTVAQGWFSDAVHFWESQMNIK
ncbi:alpha/beta hydrolase [Clostridium baratii]|uniref:alpha/beta hydrolase n=1 Tax=Clostridium baratii TaxID=1561 RepID=UPI003D327526